MGKKKFIRFLDCCKNGIWAIMERLRGILIEFLFLWGDSMQMIYWFWGVGNEHQSWKDWCENDDREKKLKRSSDARFLLTNAALLLYYSTTPQYHTKNINSNKNRQRTPPLRPKEMDICSWKGPTIGFHQYFSRFWSRYYAFGFWNRMALQEKWWIVTQLRSNKELDQSLLLDTKYPVDRILQDLINNIARPTRSRK